MQTATINSYSLSIKGLTITYTSAEGCTTLFYDSSATCDLFTDAGFIEGFDFYALTGEPVILWTDKMYGRSRSGYAHWCEFIKTFPTSPRIAEIIIESRERSKAHRQMVAKINYLLHPLKATA